MGKGKPSRIPRQDKAAIQWLDYIARKSILWAMARAARNKAAPESRQHIRLTLAERIRFKRWLWWKYGPECAYCQRFYDWRYALTIDHIQPVSKGGAVRDIRNMALACRDCNRRKGNTWDE